jgi:NAD(P)-dependent dehydrogenase (short-subunit alcohol dehydrogenase family)/acyl carrier protein
LVAADPAAGLRLPFSFAGVSLGQAHGASALRVRVRAEDDRGVALDMADVEGRFVCKVETFTARKIEPAALRGGARTESLFQIEWVEAALSDAGGAGVQVHRVPGVGTDSDCARRSSELSAETLALIQAFLGDEDLGDSRLGIVTEGAVATTEDEVPDPAAAAVWGLVRSAQSEHPGRFVLVDTDGSEASTEALGGALEIEGETQLALREGTARAPRITAVSMGEEGAVPAIDDEGTVLVTGGLIGLGALAARHLAQGGSKHLLLAGRRGADTPGAEELLAELAELGCEASAVACDVSDRAQLEALLAGIPPERPLVAVFHCAGALADATISMLDAAAVETVLAPKAGGAWHLHELTREMELGAFVLYSSAAASLGNPGQGNYAAANAFLDALAQRRRAEGLAATAISWGPWEAGMAEGLTDADRTRLARTGIAPIATDQGLELLDLARALDRPHLVAIPLDRAVLRTLARADLLPPLISRLVPASRRRSSRTPDHLARRLAEIPEEERRSVVLSVVLENVADVLGHPSAEGIDPQANFSDLGFDSLGAVELRNRLAQVTGAHLAATLVFDYPNSETVAGHLLSLVDPGAGGDRGVDPEEAEFRQQLAAIPFARLKGSGLLEMLRTLAGEESAQLDGAEAESQDEIDEMDVDELVRRTLDTPITQEV